MDQAKRGKKKVTQQCLVSIAIGWSYKDAILCDVIDKDICHLLLGRPWQHDLDSTHKGRDNLFIFYKDGQKIILA